MGNPLKLLYPDQCVSCGALVEGGQGLCGACWAATPFIDGLVCDSCGVPLLGEETGHRAHCDDCLTERPPWGRGRAALLYRDNARRLVLALKHGDRLDLVRPASGWMAARGAPIRGEGDLLVPVPLHRTRLFTRRFNQAAALAHEVGRRWGMPHLPDALVRIRRTRPQDRITHAERHANQTGAITVTARHRDRLSGVRVILVDDVMTSGATLRAAAAALSSAGAVPAAVLTLSRVAKEP